MNAVENNQYKWPENLDDIKLTSEEARKLETFAKIVANNIPKDDLYSGAFYHRRKTTVMEDGKSINLPRSLFVNKKAIVVILNKHGGMGTLEGGAQQTEIKFGWDLISGAMYVKKTVHTPFEDSFYNWLAYAPGDKPISLPKLAGVYKSERKTKFLEKCYPLTLTKALQTKTYEVDWPSLANLQESLAKLNTFSFQPPNLIVDMGNNRMMNNSEGKDRKVFFHGDISPNNIMCLTENKTSKNLLLRIIDFGASMQFDSIIWTCGYGSPETVQLYHGKLSMSREDFNAKYGQKRDAWALAMVIVSILKGGFHPAFPGSIIPNFTFIANKIKIVNRRFDDSQIATLTQEEVDNEVDALKDEKVNAFCTLQIQVIKKWLKVDPNERKTIEEALND
jgi:serine/threonine protein kinase